MEPQIVNADPKYAPVDLMEPSPHGFIHVAAAVRPGRLPLVLPSRDRSRLLAALNELARQLAGLDAVDRATVFRAIVMPPTARQSAYLQERGDALHPPNFDVVVLVETGSPAIIDEVRGASQYQALVDALRHEANDVRVIAMRNVKRVADVDRSRKGLYLFNYFAAEDVQVGLALWDYLAGWYAVETGLANSMVLAPLDGQRSDYSFINFARWDERLPRFLWQQLSTKSFRTYVLANLEANRVGSMPVLYRLA
jgi:hypothetical protein